MKFGAALIADETITSAVGSREHTATKTFNEVITFAGREDPRLNHTVALLPSGPRVPLALQVNVQVTAGTKRHTGFDDRRASQFSIHDLLREIKETVRLSLESGLATPGAPVEELPVRDITRFGSIEIDFRQMELRRYGQPVEMTAQEFKTLRYFVSRPREAISREELLNHVWGYQHYPTTRTVDNRILSLRRKLERTPSEPEHLLTVHGVGYKFVP